ncbi:MAG: trypsin-like serine protease [Myxococcales bacterium]|nr:trypsin-like serine protease [Myxococcales bacterium]MCB9549136.1 trypsin-like serine protease [Myxococcales bacterium]
MSRLRSILPALALAACAPDVQDVAPSVEAATKAIVNGTREPQITPLSEGQILALGWLHNAGDPGRNFCTGTLIAGQYVVTAKHCIEGRSGRTIGFGVGLLPSDPVASFQVEAAIGHGTTDAAILKLTEDATARVPELVPIAYNRQAPWEGLVGSDVEAGGFGETYDRSRTGRYFAVVQLERLTDTLVHVNGRGEQGICFGDSGGPVMAVNPEGEIVILGVEWEGDGSCVDRDRLTRLDVLTDWIDGILAGQEPPSQCGDVDYLGRCAGNVAEWCENGAVRQQNCERQGLVCDFVNDQVGYFCTEPPPCGDIDPRGICDGDQVARCRFGRLVFNDCAAQGQTCQTDRSGAFCRDPQPELPPDAEAPPPPPEDAGVPDAATPDEPEPEDDQGVDATTGGSERPRAASDGCQSAPGAPAGTGLGLLLIGGLLARRRRR